MILFAGNLTAYPSQPTITARTFHTDRQGEQGQWPQSSNADDFSSRNPARVPWGPSRQPGARPAPAPGAHPQEGALLRLQDPRDATWCRTQRSQSREGNDQPWSSAPRSEAVSVVEQEVTESRVTVQLLARGSPPAYASSLRFSAPATSVK